MAALSRNAPALSILREGTSENYDALRLCSDSSSGCSRATDAGQDGWLIPGRWYYAEPEPSCASSTMLGECPCPANVWNGPCFRPLDPGETRVNAFQVELKTKSSSPFRTVFARFLGQKEFRPTAIGTASLIPRRIIFGVDASGSMQKETHLDSQAESTYKLISPDPSLDCSGTPGTLSLANPNNIITNMTTEQFGWEYQQMPDIRPGPGTSTQHYKSDYTCFSVPNDPLGPANYLIDTYTKTDVPSSDPNYYEGPQPQSRIFRAIKIALEEFAKRGVPGDLVGVYAFDRHVYDSAPDRKLGPVRPSYSEPEFQDMMTLVDPTDPNHWSERAERMWFVRIDPEPDGAMIPWEVSSRGIFSNLYWFLAVAHQDLTAQSDFEYADNHVVLFSDLLANCRPPNINGAFPYGVAGPNTMRCINNLDTLYYSKYHSVRTMINSHYVKDGIALNLIASGTGDLGYFRMPQSNNKCGCMSEEQFREDPQANLGLDSAFYTQIYNNGKTQIHSSAEGTYLTTYYLPWSPQILTYLFDNNPDTKFYEVHEWYVRAARNTGGLWGPILDCCRETPHDTSSPCTDITSVLESGCQGLNAYGADTDGNGCADSGVPLSFHRMPANQNYTDYYGRLTCDAQGRDADQQMLDYIREILGQNPYVLVAPNKSVIP